MHSWFTKKRSEMSISMINEERNDLQISLSVRTYLRRRVHWWHQISKMLVCNNTKYPLHFVQSKMIDQLYTRGLVMRGCHAYLSALVNWRVYGESLGFEGRGYSKEEHACRNSLAAHRNPWHAYHFEFTRVFGETLWLTDVQKESTY